MPELLPIAAVLLLVSVVAKSEVLHRQLALLLLLPSAWLHSELVAAYPL